MENIFLTLNLHFRWEKFWVVGGAQLRFLYQKCHWFQCSAQTLDAGHWTLESVKSKLWVAWGIIVVAPVQFSFLYPFASEFETLDFNLGHRTRTWAWQLSRLPPDVRSWAGSVTISSHLTCVECETVGQRSVKMPITDWWRDNGGNQIISWCNLYICQLENWVIDWAPGGGG